jgi:hypothetical protein
MLHTLRPFALASLLLPAVAAAQVAPAAPEAAKPAAPAAAPITTADELLTALENADKDLTTLQANLVYTKTPNELVGGSAEVRTGSLWFFSRPTPPEPGAPAPAEGAPPAQNQRLFQVEFLELELDNARREDRQVWIFDGTSLVEKNFKTRLLHRRQVVKPGEKVDPLAIGEGPLPIPIGQKREKILERFDAVLTPAADGFPQPPKAKPDAPDVAPPSWIDTTYQLHLKPKRGTQEARDFQEVRIWYRKDDLLPRLASAVHKDGSRTQILLLNTQVNKDFADTVFDTKTPKGWDEQIDDFRQAKNADE